LLIVVGLVDSSQTFSQFYGIRCWLASIVQLAAIFVVFIILRFKKWKEKGFTKSKSNLFSGKMSSAYIHSGNSGAQSPDAQSPETSDSEPVKDHVVVL
jgi:hypothetical protein